MPTTRLKNRLYRMALPLAAPRLPRRPAITVQGHAFSSLPAYARLLRRHHVLGSAALISAGEQRCLLLSSSEKPRHIAEEGILFRVASITKMATALAVLTLSDRGLLDMDRPFRDFFPEEKSLRDTAAFTPRQLLSHTAGLADPPDPEQPVLSGIPFPTLLASCRIGAPGSGFRYANLGFGLLGCLMEQLCGEPVSRVVRDTVFDPLGMHATLDASTLDPARIMPISRVLPYHPGRDLTVTRLGAVPLTRADPLRHYGHTAGSMYTDMASLHRLIRCLRDDGAPLLSPRTAQAMKTRHAAYGALSPTLSYGLGLLLVEDPALSDGRILGHQGFAYGCVDGAFWEENTGNTVIFCNGGASEARAGRLGLCNRDVLRLMLRKEFPLWQNPSG